jgi:hypothetical protein
MVLSRRSGCLATRGGKLQYITCNNYIRQPSGIQHRLVESLIHHCVVDLCCPPRGKKISVLERETTGTNWPLAGVCASDAAP